MPVDVRPVVVIRRPRRDVAAFMFDPANDLRWTGGITASTPAQPGQLVTGSTVERTARFLGRTFTYGYIVTQHDPDRMVELKVDRPFPMLVRYELDDDPAGTTGGHPRRRNTRPLLRVGHTLHGAAGPPQHLRRSRAAPLLPRNADHRPARAVNRDQRRFCRL